MQKSDNNIKKGLLAWFADNHVAANLLMMAVITGGLIYLSTIKQEVFPEFSLDVVKITVSYPGATPEEVEEGTIMAIEEEVRALEEVDRVTAIAQEGRATVIAELISGVDPNNALQEIKSAVDRITSLPEDAERPVISLQTRRGEVIRLALTGEMDERTRYDMANRIREELIDLPEITQVELRGVREPEISIEVPRHTLRAYSLTLGKIAAAIRSQAIDIPAGGIKTKGGEVLLRTKERRDYAAEFEEISVINGKDGTEVRLSDIATIKEGFAETENEAYYNGRRAALINVFRIGEETPNGISAAVLDYIENLRPVLPPGTELAAYRDRSELYRDRLDLLLSNGALGLTLVIIALGLFLEARLAFWVAMGIPISITGSFIILKLTGGSINMISLFAYIITLGIVVDDAVVVGENIYYHRQQGMSPLAAAVTGVREMTAPVVIAVSTNVLAFLPLLFVTGSTGRFFGVLPAVIISVFTISLLECLFVLPSHLNYPRRERGVFMEVLEAVPDRCARGLDWVIEHFFSPVLSFCLNFRYLTALVGLLILLVSYTYWRAGWIDFSFRPRIQTDSIDAEIELPYGSPIDEVRRIVKLVEEGGLRAVEKNGGMKIVRGVMTDIDGGNTAQITFNLVPQGEREITTREFSVEWRQEVGDIPGLERLFFDYVIGPGGSAAINVELTHPDPKTLESAASDLAAELASYNGVTDIDDGFARGKPQLDFNLTAEGRSMGLTAMSLGSQVRHAFYGAEALRQQRGRDEVKVMVRVPDAERRSLYNLEKFIIFTPEGGEVPLERAADITRGRAYTQISRVDGKRVLNVKASVIQGQTNENKVIASLKSDFMSELAARYPGLKYSFEGQQREQRKSMNDLRMGLTIAMTGIFCFLAIPFRSYAQAVLVMLSIPFGLVCAIFGHVLMGYDLSIISVFGMIALCGIVINGGLVFIITANEMLREEGKSPFEAAYLAAKRRFRPIMLTSMTTFLGLAPMIFEQSVQARFLVPMAISLGFGILFSTGVVLLLTPALYIIHQEIAGQLKTFLGRKEATAEME